MKRLLTLLLCLCVLLSAFPSSLAYTGEGNEFSDTLIDESNVDSDVIWVEDEQIPLTEIVEDEDDLYGSLSFDAENTVQLAGEYVSDQILIKFKEPWQVPGKEKQLQHEIDKFEKIGFVEGLGVYVVKLDELDKNPNSVLNRLKNNKYVEYVEPNYTYNTEALPNDPNYKTQSASYNAINAPAGWEIASGGGPIIAIVDSGVASHPDLPKPVSSYSAVSGLASTNDRKNHGTGVAGVISMIGDNNIGGAGINWDAQIMAVKTDDANGVLSTGNVAKGIIWAVDNGARVINLSLGSDSDSVTLKNAIDYAYNKGCAIFAAAGNDGKLGVSYPARYPNVMAVGGTSNGTSRASISNYGPDVDVVAVSGANTTNISGTYSTLSGTSFASPAAAALASLVWEINPYLTNDEVYDLIRHGAKPLGGGYNEQTGYGLIDIGKTLELTLATLPGSAENPAEVPLEEPNMEPKPNPIITLKGFAEITIIAGASYSEDGYTAADCDGKDITANVQVENNINKWTAGLYKVTYTVTDDFGGTTIAIRTVIVEPAPAPLPPEVTKLQPPAITVNGSDIIILHIGGTPYREQGARAIDHDGEDISNSVVVNGVPDTSKAGTYTVLYEITGKSGDIATAKRTVRVLAPTETVTRKPYGFNSQAKQGATITHTNIIADQYGWMDLRVNSIDKNMTITVEFVDAESKQAVFADTFSAAGMKQYQIGEGRYDLKVTIDKANGNSKYNISLQMPEEIEIHFAENEVPLSDGSSLLATPESTVDAVTTYIVASGDNLSSIAYKLFGDAFRWREIYEMNSDVIGSNPNIIYPGQVLTIKTQ